MEAVGVLDTYVAELLAAEENGREAGTRAMCPGTMDTMRAAAVRSVLVDILAEEFERGRESNRAVA